MGLDQFKFTVLAIGIAGSAHSGYAQSIDPIAERTSVDPIIQPELLKQESFATGRGDIFLLSEHNLFSLTSEFRTGFTNNAFRTDQSRQTDHFIKSTADFSFNTIIDEEHFVGVSLIGSVEDYNDFDQLDSGVLSLSSYYGRVIADTFYSVGAGSNWVYDKSFDELSVRQGYLSVAASKSHVISDTQKLLFTGSISYIDANPEDYSHLRINAGVSKKVSMGDNLDITAFLSGTYIDYEHYFPNLFTADRKDHSASTGVSISYTLNEHISLSASISANYSNSTINLFDYSSISGDSKVELQIKF